MSDIALVPEVSEAVLVDDAPLTSPAERSGAGLRKVLLVGYALYLLQLVGLIVYSAHIWGRYDLTSDFATFYQAWQQIGSGHLNPQLSTFAYNYPNYGYSFWQSHFELIMWPFALLYRVWPSSFVLLLVQDLALVGSGLIAMRWGLEWLDHHWQGSARAATIMGAGFTGALLINPWVYWTASYDFHFQPLAVLFALLAARDLWSGRRRGWWWAGAVLLCGDVAATYLLAIGLCLALSGRRHVRRGMILVGAGVVWLALIGALGSGKGSTLPTSYGYLAGGNVANGLPGIVAVLLGIVGHPARIWHVLRPRRIQILKYFGSTGSLGVLSVAGGPMTLAVLGPNALNVSAVYVGAIASFQNLVVVFFAAVGAVMVITWLSGRGRWAITAAQVLAAAMLVQAAVVSLHWTSKAPEAVLLVPAKTASELASVERRIPPGAEVVVSQGVIGRFGGHQWVYPFLGSFPDGQTVPVRSRTVAFVFTDVGIEAATSAQTAAAVKVVSGKLHAQTIGAGNGVEAYLWQAPRRATTVSFRKLPSG